MPPLLKKPSAWVPIALSLAMLAMLFTILFYQMATFGAIVREADEGTAAHLFQIWLVLEMLMIPFFAIKWLLKEPRQTLVILAIQIILVPITCFPVYYFQL